MFALCEALYLTEASFWRLSVWTGFVRAWCCSVWEVPFWTVSRPVAQMRSLGRGWVFVTSCVCSPSDYTRGLIPLCECALMTPRFNRLAKSSAEIKRKLFLTDILIRKWFRLHPLLLFDWNELLQISVSNSPTLPPLFPASSLLWSPLPTARTSPLSLINHNCQILQMMSN